jgi:hypothetical protein
MHTSLRRGIFAAFAIIFSFSISGLWAQSAGSGGTIYGTVTDATSAILPGATISIENPVSGYSRTTTSDNTGHYQFTNLPLNPYHLVISATGFSSSVQDVDVHSVVPLSIGTSLKVGGGSTTVTVEASDLIENDPTFHTDVDRGLFDKLPLESQSSSLSSLVTLASPGIAADSNGLFHGIGDHAENSFSVDGQPITDQVSKVFSNQIPTDSVQSLEVIDGAPTAEYGGKTSVVIVATTRSGLGTTTPHGAVTASYGTFGSTNIGGNLAYGGEKWGNFVSLSGLNTGRFLDPAEFHVFHDKGNEENFFDRADYKISERDSAQLNLNFTRSWFQTPNSYDQQLQTCTIVSVDCNAAGTHVIDPVTGALLGPTDQRSQIRTFNVAPSFTRVVNPNTVFNIGAYVRHDQYNYYPSNNLLSDLGPLQDETVNQLRFLTNAGIRSSVTYAKGINNFKLGGQYEQTFLTENDKFAIVNPGLLPNCPTALSAQCATLLPYDLTAGGQQYLYHGHTDVKELALYLQDTITKGAWVANLGIRGDFYNGLQAIDRQAEPRAGVAYNLKKTNTILRLSYARTMESPFNENLILSGTGCSNPVIFAVMTVAQGFNCQSTPLVPGYRNEFHAGFQQAISRYFVASAEYITKYTHNGYDFNVFGTTPITLPIEWHNSKIPGYVGRVSVPEIRGFSAFVVMSHVSARFFPPTVAGIAPPAPPAVFRIDHDEKFNQTTHVQYQPLKRLPWVGLNWRYDSGLVAGATPCLAATATCAFSTSVADGGVGSNPQGTIGLVNNVTGLPLTADLEYQAGLSCAGVAATPTQALPAYCLASQLKSSLISIPAPGTEQDDKNPQRIAPRSLFDLAAGDDDLFKGDKYKWSLRVTAINVTNKVALYNFLSTFSGTHYVTPRAVTGEIGFHF